MRKWEKKKAEEFVGLLEEAALEIEKLVRNQDIKSALGILEQCQEGAIKLGMLIEESEGEMSPIVKYLEEYCELVYQFHQALIKNNTISLNKLPVNLKRVLTQISSGIEKDIKIRTEVVFLPYKASMWDSLESVWKAADEDPSCDAYVIPIPYFDKDVNGNFSNEYYEGNQYPDYIPITKYDTYDFEKRRPDVVFIHNPYDEHNLVTSVHPFFYSKNLKQFTDNLVYIPYFVLDEIDPDNQEAINQIRHFCLTSGVFHADKVIVQSEDMRQIYINVLIGEMGDTKESRKYWQDKILGIGSPKIDKVRNIQKEKLEIPNEWLKLIRRTDGSWKKVIFYNTSLGALLENNDQILIKMENVFSVFKEKTDDVTLLWRPHPLFESTVKSMRPKLWKKYRKIVEQYKSEMWGIFDDTPEADRAIALSDGYYGDSSSVVHLYKKLGKPIMIQNFGCLDGVQAEK